MKTELEIPTSLPFNLSASSIDTYLKCPEKFRRRYIERERDPSSPAMLLGSSFHAAEGENMQRKIETQEDLEVADVLDIYAGEFEVRREEEEVEWGDEKPGEVKDQGAKLTELYHEEYAPLRQPLAVERRLELHLPDVEWLITGYIDLETDEDEIIDYKTRSSRMNAASAAAEVQPRVNLLARRAEGRPATFAFDTLVKTKTPQVDTVPVPISDHALDRFVERVYLIAAEIKWRMEMDVWQGALPGQWWCSERYCGFWNTCPMGAA